MIDLSEDQESARGEILAALLFGERQLVLSGPAGSGKTTLMRQLLADIEAMGRPVRLVAPTGKAAARLAELTGRTATTIHSPLYREIRETVDDKGNKTGGVEFADPKAIASGGGVIICDEASMVGRRIYADLLIQLPVSVALLCVGDREQLEPVGDSWGANFNAPTALLTAIHRQAADSPIIQLATALRTGQAWRAVRPTTAGYRVQSATVEQAASWLALERGLGADATLLCYTNRLRQSCNAQVRAMRGLEGNIAVGDMIVCTRNAYNLALMNGDVRQVADFEPIEESGGELVTVRWAEGGTAKPILAPATLAKGMAPPELDRLEALCDRIDDDSDSFDVFERGRLKKRLLQAEYGEALTVHKSQGSQWTSVGVLFDAAFAGAEERDGAAFRRLLYTAITRAKSDLVLFDVGRA